MSLRRTITVDPPEVVADVVSEAEPLGDIDGREEEALHAAALHFIAFVEAWQELVAAARLRESLFESGAVDVEQAASILQPFPASPAVLFDSAVIAATDPHATAPLFAQTHPDTVPLVELLAELREARRYSSVHLLHTATRRTLVAPDLKGRSH